jgi:hypothetical protein
VKEKLDKLSWVGKNWEEQEGKKRNSVEWGWVGDNSVKWSTADES